MKIGMAIVAPIVLVVCNASAGALANAAAAAGISAQDLPVLGVFGKTQDVMRDPKSLQVDTLLTSVSGDTAVGCMVYRARNGFGGMNVDRATWVFTNGKLFFSPNGAALWNKWCANKQMTDRTDIAKKLAKHAAESN